MGPIPTRAAVRQITASKEPAKASNAIMAASLWMASKLTVPAVSQMVVKKTPAKAKLAIMDVFLTPMEPRNVPAQ